MPPRRPVLTLDDLARPITRRPERLHALTAAELSIALSQGLDLAEGKLVGHAQRVCYIATSLADALEVDPQCRTGVYFGALLHDIGVTLAASDLCRYAGVDEEVIFGPSPLRQIPEQRGDFGFADRSAVTDAVYQHCTLGAETVRASSCRKRRPSPSARTTSAGTAPASRRDWPVTRFRSKRASSRSRTTPRC